MIKVFNLEQRLEVGNTFLKMRDNNESVFVTFNRVDSIALQPSVEGAPWRLRVMFINDPEQKQMLTMSSRDAVTIRDAFNTLDEKLTLFHMGN